MSVLFIIIMAFSCKSSNDVASNNLIQKRKYMKGYYVNSQKPIKNKQKEIIITEISNKGNNELDFVDDYNNDTELESQIDLTEIFDNSKKENLKNDDRIQITLKGIINESKIQSNKKLDKLTKKLVKKLSKRTLLYPDDDPIIKKTEPLGLVGGIIGIVSLLVLPLFFGAAAIVFSAISLSKFSKNPELYKGKGWAIAGLILGVISVVYGIIVLGGA